MKSISIPKYNIAILPKNRTMGNKLTNSKTRINQIIQNQNTSHFKEKFFNIQNSFQDSHQMGPNMEWKLVVLLSSKTKNY